jgi:hypothetical protein
MEDHNGQEFVARMSSRFAIPRNTASAIDLRPPKLVLERTNDISQPDSHGSHSSHSSHHSHCSRTM